MVSLKVNLISCTDSLQSTLKFNSSFKALIFDKLESSKFKLDKNNDMFRLFSFSNLFFIKNGKLKKNEIYSVIISSSIPDLILHLIEKFDEHNINYDGSKNFRVKNPIHLGESEFGVESIKIFREDVSSEIILESVGPIVLKSGKDKKGLMILC